MLVFFAVLVVPVFRLFGSWGPFDITCAVFLLEPFYSPSRIDVFLFACIERMAHRADFCVDFFYRAASLEGIAAAAMNHYLFVFWMYLFFHSFGSQKYPKISIITLSADISTEIFIKLAMTPATCKKMGHHKFFQNGRKP